MKSQFSMQDKTEAVHDSSDSSSPFQPSWLYTYNEQVPVLNCFTLKSSKIIFAAGDPYI